MYFSRNGYTKQQKVNKQVWISILYQIEGAMTNTHCATIFYDGELVMVPSSRHGIKPYTLVCSLLLLCVAIPTKIHL